jgi:hypothetical protein
MIGTKWVFRNKQDEFGVITNNKARLVGKVYTQVEGLDFGETYAPVGLNQFLSFWPMLLIMISSFIKWM